MGLGRRDYIIAQHLTTWGGERDRKVLRGGVLLSNCFHKNQSQIGYEQNCQWAVKTCSFLWQGHYLVFLKRMVRAILAFEKDRAGFKTFQGMPAVFLYIQHPEGAISIEGDAFGLMASVIIENPTNLATENSHGFRTLMMAMNRHHCPWLQGIQHPL